MNKRITPIENDEPRHKKKSKKKGQPRADHKHEYKTVLLHSYFDNPFRPGERFEEKRPVTVCTVCGRVGEIDMSGYEYIKISGTLQSYNQEIKDEGTLEKWYLDDFFDKFAYRKPEPAQEET